MSANTKSTSSGERAASREAETKAVIQEFRRKGRPVRPIAPTNAVQSATDRDALSRVSERQV
jgi:hypothetical protein